MACRSASGEKAQSRSVKTCQVWVEKLKELLAH